MTRVLLPASFLLLILGCDSTLDQRLSKKQNEINTAAAEKIEKAKSLTDVKSALEEQAAQQTKINKDVQSLNPQRRARFVEKTAVSQANLRDALSTFQERLRDDPANPVVLIDTTEGPITVELYANLAPITVKNFLGYVDDKFYDGTIFHRVIPTFMIQGGGFEPGMRKEKPTRDPIPNESYNGLTNDRGTIAMARTPNPNSATAQFFINVADNAGLNKDQAQDGFGYAVFGKVTKGMDTVDKIRRVKTHSVGGHQDVPVEDVVIKSIRRVEKKT